jgi:hypothetical protein
MSHDASVILTLAFAAMVAASALPRLASRCHGQRLVAAYSAAELDRAASKRR